MSVSKTAVRNAIAGYRKQGFDDNQIMLAIAKRKDGIGKAYNAAIADGMTADEFASSFGLNYNRQAMIDANNKSNAGGVLDKAKSYGLSALSGLAKSGGYTVQQGAALGADKINSGINSVLGTHLKTDNLNTVNKRIEQAEKDLTGRRRKAGRNGTDWVETGAQIAATLPVFLATDGAAGAAGLGLKGRTLAQSAAGAGVGAAGYAPDTKTRQDNILWGALGGGLGEVGGAAVGKVAKKGYNVINGNKKAGAQAVEDLAKKHGVRTSVGDVGRGAVTKKAETLTEQVPVVGMAGFREAQHGEAKAAAGKVAKGFSDTLNNTDYKDLGKIRQAAARGDRNAARIQKIVDKAQTPDEVIQASLAVRQWREKNIAGKMYDRVSNAINELPNKVVTPTKTKSLLGDKLDELSKSLAPDDALQRDLAGIQARFADPNVTIDFDNMRLLRSQLGDLAEKYAQGAHPNKSASKYFGDLRQAVGDDIDDFIANSGNADIKALYKRADGYYKSMMARQDRAFAKAMDSNKPDEIYSQFVKTGKADRAANFYNALDRKGQAAVRSKMVEDALDKATNPSTGFFSPAKFAGEFERLREPYGVVFSGADKQEMDGFVKLMRHVERAGQYMENPPTGNRLVGGAVGGSMVADPILALKGAGATAIARTLFTTKAGKRLLLAANELPPNAAGFGKILDRARIMAADLGANMGTDGDAPQDVLQVVPQDTLPVDTPVDIPTNNAPPVDGVMPMPADYVPSEAFDIPQVPEAMSQAMPPTDTPAQPADLSQQAVLPRGAAPQSATRLPLGDAPADLPADMPPSEPPQPVQPMAHEQLEQALTQLIPPPKETDNAQKQLVYEQIATHSVNRVLQNPVAQQIVNELQSDAPDEAKIKTLQKRLAKTDEWQAYLQNLSKEQRKQASDGNILALLTKTIRADTPDVFNPQF